MPVVGNRYYNDPSIGQAFSNLAAAFAPPSGGDLAGYASAKAKREEAQRLADLFSYAQDPAFQQQTFDRMGQATGQWTPSQGYYGVDVGARTARENNAADNARALQQTQMTNTKDITTSLLAPVAQGATRFVPPSIADMYQVDPTQVGNVAASQGERIVTPDGRVIEGAAKPMSETEVKGAALQQLTPEEMKAIAMGDIPVETVMQNGKPVIVRRPDAVGQEPFINKGAEAKPTNYITPDGAQGTAVMGPEGLLIDTQTRQPLPAGSQMFGTNVQGTKSDALGPTTANQTEANKIEAELAFGKDRLTTYRDLLEKNPGVAGVSGKIRGFAQDIVAFTDEMAQAYGQDAIQGFGSAEDVKAFAEKYANARGFDPAIKQAAAMALEMAYYDAKSADPSGEVNVKELQMNLDKYDGGLSGNKGVLANLDVLEGKINSKLKNTVGTLRNPGTSEGAQPDGADAIAQAKQAIARGANRDQVIERLKNMGFSTEGL